MFELPLKFWIYFRSGIRTRFYTICFGLPLIFMNVWYKSATSVKETEFIFLFFFGLVMSRYRSNVKGAGTYILSNNNVWHQKIAIDASAMSRRLVT